MDHGQARLGVTSLAPLKHTSERFEIRSQRPIDIVAIADSHSRPHSDALHLIGRLTPELILHAGDIGELGLLSQLGKLAPVLAIRGNIDEHTPGLADSMDIALCAGGRSRLKLLLIHRAIHGVRLRADVARVAKVHAAGLVVFGHSHIPFIGRDKGIAVFNPGSMGPRRLGLPITFGVIHVAADGISLRHVDCETGETWCP